MVGLRPDEVLSEHESLSLSTSYVLSQRKKQKLELNTNRIDKSTQDCVKLFTLERGKEHYK